VSSTRITSKGRTDRDADTEREGGAGARRGHKIWRTRQGCRVSVPCRTRRHGEAKHMWGARTSAVQCTHLPDEVGRAMLAVLGRSTELLGDVGFHCEPGPCIFRSLDQPGAHRQGRVVKDRSAWRARTQRGARFWALVQRSSPAPAHRYHPRASLNPCSWTAVSSDLGTAHAALLTDRTRPRLHPGRHLSARCRRAVVVPKPAVPLASNSLPCLLKSVGPAPNGIWECYQKVRKRTIDLFSSPYKMLKALPDGS
jgi:hypothetical protein